VKLLPAVITEDRLMVRCGELTCGYDLARVLGAHLLVTTFGLVERLDDAGQSRKPPCYWLDRSIRKRFRTAAHTGKGIAPLRSRVMERAGVGRVIDLDLHEEVWIQCPRGCRSVTVVQSAEVLRHGAPA